ncbi:MAG: hypothetical protein F9K09_01650 [Flavobacteriales bacterium]|nr:MAG: hypothetical protein F9K09_01650 [Flavobacteriales bacterium]
MKFFYSITILLFLVSEGIAQQTNTFFNDTIPRLNISINGQFDYGSNVASNQFINKFIFGGKIDQQNKTNLYKNLGSRNTIGGDFNLSFKAEIPVDSFLGKTNFSFLIGIEHNEHFDGKFSSDLSKIIFDGNKPFAGKHANISGTNFNYINYQQLNFGFINFKKSRQKTAREGAVFSIIKAQEHQAIIIPDGTLFTEQFGKQLEVDINYTYNSSDSTKKGIKAFNGIGISTDLFTEFYVKNNGKISIEINDLGFIQWGKKSIQIEADTLLIYDGVEVDNVFDLNDSIISSFSQDSLLDYVSTKKSKGGYAIALPTSINLNYQHTINSKWNASIGIKHRILANYFPLIYSNIQYYITPKFIVQGNLLYGGYGKFNGGITIAKQFKDNFQLVVGTTHLGAFILPSATYSNNGFLQLKVYF